MYIVALFMSLRLAHFGKLDDLFYLKLCLLASVVRF
jgi:hypothetical protein